MIKVNNLTKIYGNKKAVDDISFDIKKGEIFGFIGHNGAGKTTTIKSIVGLINYDEGEILINGKNVQDSPIECKKDIAYIPDNPDLYNYMTGIKYLNFIADIFEVPSNIREKRIKKYADLLEITSNLNSSISSYSHGMKQKLALISAWIHEPKLIIMDEPFVGLDPVSSHALKELMKEHCKNGGSIFFSTHVLEVAEKLCDRIAIIKKGKIIKIGTLKEVTNDESLESVFLELSDSEVK